MDKIIEEMMALADPFALPVVIFLLCVIALMKIIRAYIVEYEYWNFIISWIGRD